VVLVLLVVAAFVVSSNERAMGDDRNAPLPKAALGLIYVFFIVVVAGFAVRERDPVKVACFAITACLMARIAFGAFKNAYLDFKAPRRRRAKRGALLRFLKGKGNPRVEDAGLLESAFQDGTSPGDGAMVFHVTEIGTVAFPSGRIVACDPFTLSHDGAFTAEFPKGSFPIDVAIAVLRGGDERVAFARIRFSEQDPVQWEMALTEKQAPADLEPGEFYGYGVDSGTGGFMDADACDAILEAIGENPAESQAAVDKMDVHYRPTRSWMIHAVAGHEAAYFSSGFGDGLYSSFIGRDASGGICRLVTDFKVVGPPA
jgi:hypothetical protein